MPLALYFLKRCSGGVCGVWGRNGAYQTKNGFFSVVA